MGFLFGSKKSSNPTNQFAGFLKDKFAGSIDQGNQGMNYLSALLTGQGDTAGANSAWDRFKSMAGYAPAMRQLAQRTTGQGAAAGLLNSGTTATRLQDRGAELNQGMFGNFLQQLSGLTGLGQNAGQIISGAGGQNTTQGPSTASKIFSTIGAIGSIFSDRATKCDIEKVAEFDDGLGVYKFRYLGDDEIRVGVMADEVEIIRPWALGPMVGPFRTVNYAAL